MKPYVTIGRVALLRLLWCVGAAASIAWAATTPPDLFDEIYAKGRPLESSLRTLSARFTETTTSSLLTRPLVARGTLAVIRPERVVLRYDGPEPRTVLIDGATMRLAWPARSIDQRTNIGAAQQRIAQYFVSKSPAQLRSHFTISATVAIDPADAWLVTMTPTRRQIREGLSTLELWLDRTSVMLVSMRMTFPNGDTKLMEFEQVKVNPEIDPALFQITTQ